MDPASSQVGRRHRVLIVDDNPAIHGDFRKILGARGEAVAKLDALAADLFGAEEEPESLLTVDLDSAHQGQEALALVLAARTEGRPYELAFMDVRMPPGWDGIETTQRLWEVDPHLQVVICTAYSDYSWKEMLARLGMTDRLLLLKKPFDTIEVAQLTLAMTRKWCAEEATRRHLSVLEEVVRARTHELLQSNEQLRDEMARRAAMEGELRMAQKLEAIGKLAAGLAHEINNPAQFVTHNVEFLVEAFASFEQLFAAHEAIAQVAATADVAETERATLALLGRRLEPAFLRSEVPVAAEQALSGMRRISRIVGAMLEFAHTGGDQKAHADLQRAIESTVTICENQWKTVADLVLELGPTPQVPCRIGAIKQALLSLIANAAQAMEKRAGEGVKGVLRIKTWADAHWAVIEVQDTGAGIPEEIRERVFDPFFSTREVGQGAGQGLAVARSIVVEQHGGTLGFVSEVGEGTTFTIRLPLAEVVADAA